jgi:hypothetical protein
VLYSTRTCDKQSQGRAQHLETLSKRGCIIADGARFTSVRHHLVLVSIRSTTTTTELSRPGELRSQPTMSRLPHRNAQASPNTDDGSGLASPFHESSSERSLHTPDYHRYVMLATLLHRHAQFILPLSSIQTGSLAHSVGWSLFYSTSLNSPTSFRCGSSIWAPLPHHATQSS